MNRQFSQAKNTSRDPETLTSLQRFRANFLQTVQTEKSITSEGERAGVQLSHLTVACPLAPRWCNFV